MSIHRSHITVASGNLLVSCLAGLWGYTAYMYNWLNVGGGAGNVEFWDSMREAVPYVAMVAWVCLVIGVVVFRREISSSLASQVAVGAISFSLAPAVLTLSDWFLHRGFPKAPM
ncbi:hypothetical protein J2X16_002359 [Pelomonas aquatica]|uniref:Uncharacterized protein n=1 Tax=Pelomonas aquatica TaxID=431058 RepID=A0ABU1Z8T4_9BURK|nr:hypothetical protein [Pelomonas aquatica]MDR7297012.1 hypothetical protein [Pelomonas aquatica]